MILDDIVTNNVPDLEERKRKLPLQTLEGLIVKQSPPVSFATAIKGDKIKFITEVKKASPSKGIIKSQFDHIEIARTYASNGAAAISVLTENKYFQGSLRALSEIREALGNKKPLLRKDFIHDVYQVYEARAYGADAILLITAILTTAKLHELLEVSHTLGMYCLVEIHDEKELNVVLGTKAKIIGINNRDLNTFKVDLGTTERLRPLIDKEHIVVSESGIQTRVDVLKLQQLEVDALLIGEAFMSADNIVNKMKELM
jgi:indole-3-glycerol phosphate synthase